MNQNIIGQSLDLTDGWMDAKVENLDDHFHKMTSIGNSIWAADYGGGVLYCSHDNGKSWTKSVTLGFEYAENIQFIDDSVGYVSGDYGFVYKTIDGGESWIDTSPEIEGRITERYRSDTTKNQKPDGYFSAYYVMQFVSKEEGIVSGYKYNPAEGFRNSFQRLLFHTNNGGNSWNEIKEDKQALIDGIINKSSLNYNRVMDIFYFNEDESIMLSLNKEKNDIAVFCSKTNEKADTIPIPAHPYERVMLRNTLFLDRMHGLILGGSLDENNQKAVIYETLDGGQSWKYIPSELPHIHAAIIHKNVLWIAGKKDMIKYKTIR